MNPKDEVWTEKKLKRRNECGRSAERDCITEQVLKQAQTQGLSAQASSGAARPAV